MLRRAGVIRTPKQSIIIPIFNGLRYLPYFWATLCESIHVYSEVIIIDDGSSQDVFSSIPAFSSNVILKQIHHDKSQGYSSSINDGLKVSSGEYLFVVNSDIILFDNTLDVMRDELEHDDMIGCLGAKLLYPQTGRIQHFGVAFTETRKFHVFTHARPNNALLKISRECQAVTFALCGFRRSVYEQLGPLSTKYRNSNEDIDYCLRARDHGFRNVVCANGVAYHWESQSGPTRFATNASNEAQFWTKWGEQIVPDLTFYMKDSWHYMNNKLDYSGRYIIIDLSKGNKTELNDLISVIGHSNVIEVWNYRQFNNSNYTLWLPMILPPDIIRSSIGLIYYIDELPQILQNYYWFSMRKHYNTKDIIVDRYANIVYAHEEVYSTAPSRLKSTIDVS